MNRIFQTITRALQTRPEQDAVHFHGGAHGAFVCENAQCVSPGLDPADR